MTVEIEMYCPACGKDSGCAGNCLGSLFVDEEDSFGGVTVYVCC